MADEVKPFKSLTINCNNKELNLSWTILRKSEVSKTTYFSPFLAYDAIIKLTKSLKSIIFSKFYDEKHYFDNQSEDSNKGYLRKAK